MKQEDIDRLKTICEKEGFELTTAFFNGEMFHISKKKDPWDGVKFVLHVPRNLIYKVKSMTETHVICESGPISWNCDFNPSTEQKYIDQLKKEAFERFGDIKRGDMFERNWKLVPGEYKYGVGVIGEFKEKGFKYNEDNDTLMYNGTTIYRQGQWATKLPERVTVEYKASYGVGSTTEFHFTIKTTRDKSGELLAKQLEKHLNDEQ